MKRNYIVIIIAGSTNGGKTSVSDRLVKEYPNSIEIKQDDYFYEANHPNHVWIELANKIRHQDWECVGSLDWIKFDERLAELDEQLIGEKFRKQSSSNRPNDEQTNDDRKMNDVDTIEVNNNCSDENRNLVNNLESIKKRIKLVLIEGHVVLCHQFPKFFNIDRKIFFTLSEEVCKARRSTRHYIPPDPPNYFEEIVWPSYLEHFAYAKANHPDTIFIDGEMDKETIFQQIKNEIDNVYLSLI